MAQAQFTITKISDGQKGDEGRSIDTIEAQYAISTSKTTPPSDSDWVSSCPQWEKDKYIWTRSKITYKNPTGIEYTEPYCDSSWEAANDVNDIIENFKTGEYSTFKTSVTSFETEQGSINAVLKDTIIYKKSDGTYASSEAYNTLVSDVSGSKQTIADITTVIGNENDVLGSRITTIENTAKGVSSIVESNKVSWNGAVSDASSAKSIAEQTADKLSWVVSDGSTESNLSLTNTALTAIADNIDLTGNVSFNGKFKSLNYVGANMIKESYLGASQLNMPWDSCPYFNLSESIEINKDYTFSVYFNKNFENAEDNTDDLHVVSHTFRIDSVLSENKIKILISKDASSDPNILISIILGENEKTIAVDGFKSSLITYNDKINVIKMKLEKGDRCTEYTSNFTNFDAWISDSVKNNVTTINGGYIQASTIGVDHLAVGEIFSDGSSFMNELKTVEFSADNIVSGQITTDRLDLYNLNIYKKEDEDITDEEKIQTLRITEDGEITIRGDIESYNYVNGVSGWAIESNGDAEFNDVIIRGSLINSDGGITNDTRNGDENPAIRFWAGSSYEERENAPFIVYDDGSLKSTLGNIGGVFTGDIRIGNVSITDPSSVSGGDANISITRGDNGSEIISLSDSDSSYFKQNVYIKNDYGSTIGILNDGIITLKDSIIVGDSHISKLGNDATLNLDGSIIKGRINTGLNSDKNDLEITSDTITLVGAIEARGMSKFYNDMNINSDIYIESNNKMYFGDSVSISIKENGIDFEWIGD